jgi:hypothetical protein
MTTYNDFIADLTSEDLLDGTKFNLPKGQDDFLFSRFSVPLRVVDNSSATLPPTDENRQLKLPDFSFLQNDFAIEENSELAFVALENEPAQVYQPALKRKVKKVKKGFKHCDLCDVRVPLLSLRCRFCHSLMINKFIYYSLISLAVIAGIGMSVLTVLYIVTRNYI